MTQPSDSERLSAVLAHLLGWPTWLLGPLVIFLLKRGESDFVRDQAAEALNFQITRSVLHVVCFVLNVIFIGWLLATVVEFLVLVALIVAAVRSNEGERFRYPLCLRLVR